MSEEQLSPVPEEINLNEQTPTTEVPDKPVENDPAHPDFNKIQEERKKTVDGFKQMFLHKYDLEKINMEEELEKVKNKVSNLSRRQRDAVVAYFQIFKESLNEQKSQEIETNRKPIVPNDGSKPVEKVTKEDSSTESNNEE